MELQLERSHIDNEEPFVSDISSITRMCLKCRATSMINVCNTKPEFNIIPLNSDWLFTMRLLVNEAIYKEASRLRLCTDVRIPRALRFHWSKTEAISDRRP